MTDRELLKQAMEALEPFADAMRVALERMKSAPVAEYEALAKHHVKGGSFVRVIAVHAAIAEALKEETRPADRYPVELIWSDEDAGWIATAPDLPGCSAWGATRGDALREIGIVIPLWVESCQGVGNTVPEPTTLPMPKDKPTAPKGASALPPNWLAEEVKKVAPGTRVDSWFTKTDTPDAP